MTRPAWTNIVSAGAGQLQDVADAPGDWADNAAFKSLHSQDPRTTMDDRFDIQFASGEFFDGGGVDYVSNSFHIFGNNGTHTLNQPITTGTGASTDVLNALVAASDHLPAVADYKILATTPSVRISETLGGTKVVEGGLYDTYQLVLNTVPAVKCRRHRVARFAGRRRQRRRRVEAIDIHSGKCTHAANGRSPRCR